MRKRGQITIFVIVAILIIAGVALFFTMKGTLHKESTVNSEIAPVVNFVQTCLKQVSSDVIYKVAEGGGYYSPVPGFSTSDLGIAYYKKGNSYHIPSQNKVEQEISKYIASNLLNCTNNFSSFSDYEISQSTPIVRTKISQHSLDINLFYPLTINKGNSTFELKSFNLNLESPFGLLYNATNEYIKQESQDKGICLTCIFNIEQNFGVDISSLRLDNNTVLFIFTDKQQRSLDQSQIIKYAFANEYK